MTTSDIAARLDARPAGPGKWMARCPGHRDGHPSLSLREGREGRTLVRCFAGCDVQAIVRAAGLDLADLFAQERRHDAWRITRRDRVRRPTGDDVEQAAQAELERIVAEESERSGFEVATLARHRNQARTVVERRFGLNLRRECTPWFEVEPHAIDPEWSACVECAFYTVVAESDLDVDTLRFAIGELPEAQYRALTIARELQRELVTSTSA